MIKKILLYVINFLTVTIMWIPLYIALITHPFKMEVFLVSLPIILRQEREKKEAAIDE